MVTVNTLDEINQHRRRFFGAAAMSIAAAQLGVIRSANAQTAETKLPATTPGTHTSFGPLKQIDAGLQAEVDDTRGLLDAVSAPGVKEFIAATEGACTEAEEGDFKSGFSEKTIFHIYLTKPGDARLQTIPPAYPAETDRSPRPAPTYRSRPEV